jgi:hypothetical protein
LKTPRVPRGVEVMNPNTKARTLEIVRAIFDKYKSDNRKRTLIIGINPGRFGAGLTGVTFADPVALADECGIPNDFPKKRELSSVFVFLVVNHMGGPEKFFSKFFLSALCPLGFTRKGKNLNYYDDPSLARAVTPFIVSSIESQIEFGCRRDRVIVLGRGANADFLRALNKKRGWFKCVYALDHPRPIMQYNRKRVDAFIRTYESVLTAVGHQPSVQLADG